MTRRHPGFEERVYTVVRNFVEYGNYGGSEKRASAVIRKHCPERNAETCLTAFRVYRHAYLDAVVFVKRQASYYHDLRQSREIPRTGSGSWPKSPEEAAFTAEHPEVPEEWILTMLWFIYDWHHVR
mgnify:FL=1